MNHHSEEVSIMVKAALSGLKIDRFYSDKDETWLVGIQCWSCGDRYEELYDKACDDVVLDQKHLCIKCDSAADEPVETGKLAAVVQWWLNL